MKSLFAKLKKPKGLFLVCVYLFTICFVSLAIANVILDKQGVFVYVAYGLAGTSLAYSIYTMVVYAKGFKTRVKSWLVANKFTAKIMSQQNFRVGVFVTFSFAMTVLVAVANAWLGYSQHSIWFGSLAGYYILLAVLRGALLNRLKRQKSGEKSYLHCGILLVVLNMSLSVAIAQMIFEGRAFVYLGWTVFAFAFYAFYKLVWAIYNCIKTKKQQNWVLKAIRNVSLIDATVSILALQTALLYSFNDGSVNISLFNTMTGIVVSLVINVLAIFMIIKGKKYLKYTKEK